jgi:dUTP pyrophosphatase
MKVKIINESDSKLPAYATENSAGVDLYANSQKQVTLKPLERQIISTGIFIELPTGYEAQIRPRSGLAANYGITVLNTPGTIDSDYRGEIKVILVNLSNDTCTINHGDRIAQMIIAKHEHVEFDEVDNLSETERGNSGFGSTGTK